MHQVGIYVIYELILLDQGYIHAEITHNIIINGRGVINNRGRKGGAVVYQPCTLM